MSSSKKVTTVALVTTGGALSSLAQALRGVSGVVTTTYHPLDVAKVAARGHQLVIIEDYDRNLDSTMVLRGYNAACIKLNQVPACMVVAVTSARYENHDYRTYLTLAGATGIVAVPADYTTLVHNLLNVAAWGPQREVLIRYGRLAIDHAMSIAYLDDKPVTAVSDYVKVIELLIKNGDRVVTTYDALAKHLGRSDRQTRKIVGELRTRLRYSGGDPIANVWGRGYVIAASRHLASITSAAS